MSVLCSTPPCVSHSELFFLQKLTKKETTKRVKEETIRQETRQRHTVDHINFLHSLCL